MDSSKRKQEEDASELGNKKSKVGENLEDMRKIVKHVLEKAFLELTKRAERKRKLKVLRKMTRRKRLKIAIVKQLSGLEGNAVAGAGWLDKEVPSHPLVRVEGYGTVGLPVNSHVAIELGKYMEQAPYGMGEETVLDKTMRDSLQVGPDKFMIGNEEFSKAVNSVVVDRVKMELGLKEMTVWAEPYKLLLYKPGGHFKPHRDTEKAPGMFGTLIVQLPSVFTGGDLVIRHGGREVMVEMSQKGSFTHCVVAAHYSDVLHELRPVESGYRLALVFSLCWRGAGQVPSAEVMVDRAMSLQSLMTKYINSVETSVPRLCWGLEHLYSSNSLENGGVNVLKRSDRSVVEIVMSANQKLDKNEKFDIYLAKATKVDHEYGSCTNDSGWGRWDGGCCGDVDMELKEFVALNGSKFDFKTEFDPDEVLNFEDEENFWGEGTGECSGPSGNEGATRDMWYNKWVLVMWRRSDGFLIKSNVSIKAGLLHILSTCKAGDMVGARDEVNQLLSMLNNGNHKLADTDETSLEVALSIEDPDLCQLIIEMFVRTITSQSVISKLQALVTKYTLPVLHTTMLKLFDKANISQIGNFAQFFSGIVNTPLSFCDAVVEKLSAFQPKTSTYGSYNTNPLTSSMLIPVLDLMLKFPIQLSILGKQLSNSPSLSSLSVCADLISFLVTKKSATQLLVDIEERFMHEAGKLPKLSPEVVAVSKLASVLVTQGRETSLQSLSRLVLAQPDRQDILSTMLSNTCVATPNMSATLVILVRARVTFLQSEGAGGPPKFSWRQSKAVVPGHSVVERFFKSDKPKFIYREFTGIKHARNWTSKHRNDSGTCASMSPGGTGAEAFVEIVKKEEGFIQGEMKSYKSNLEELNRLLGCLPASSVPQTVNLSATTTTSSSSTSIYHGETIDLT